MILVDTSALVSALTGERRSAPALRSLVDKGERLALSTLVLYEWLRGPRLAQELEDQGALFPPSTWIPFGSEEARVAAELYRLLPRARGREVDLAIAASALEHGAGLWTLNPGDFEDIPGLDLYQA